MISPLVGFFDLPEDRQSGHRVLSDAFRRAPELWDGPGERLLEDLMIAAGARPDDCRDLLLSEEGMGRQASRPAHLGAHLRALARACRRSGFDRTRVLAFIRRQDTWLASHYAQVSGSNPDAGQKDFERLVAQVADPRGARYGFGMMLDWRALHRTLCDAVGEENVLLIPHERLAADRAEVLDGVGRWLGADRNTIQSLQRAAGPHRSNVRSQDGFWALRDRPRTVGPLRLSGRLRRRGGRIALTGEISRTILASYAPANAALCDAGVDVARFGYCP